MTEQDLRAHPIQRRCCSRSGLAPERLLRHPGGALGRKLLLKVEDIMHAGEALPAVSEKATLSEALLEMTEKRLGFTTILDSNGHLTGVFSDGDLRRAIEAGHDHGSRQIWELMTRGGTTI